MHRSENNGIYLPIRQLGRLEGTTRRPRPAENSAPVRLQERREERRLFTVHTRNRGNVDSLASNRNYSGLPCIN